MELLFNSHQFSFLSSSWQYWHKGQVLEVIRFYLVRLVRGVRHRSCVWHNEKMNRARENMIKAASISPLVHCTCNSCRRAYRTLAVTLCSQMLRLFMLVQFFGMLPNVQLLFVG